MLVQRSVRNVVLAAALLVAGMCHAQQPGSSPTSPVPQASPAPQEAPAPVIQDEAIDALTKMGAYLHTLKAFSVTSDITIDEVLLSGQKIQVGGVNTLTVRRPRPRLLRRTQHAAAAPAERSAARLSVV